jgi:8-amino-7-oxononanoate synthase
VSWDLTGALNDLESSGLRRHLRVLEPATETSVCCDGRELRNFASNDYLGLAGSAFLREALAGAVQAWGAGAGASRLVTGTSRAHAELEVALARFKGTEAALSFASGHATALGTLPALLGAGDTILLDKLSHACLVDAARLSGATIRVFPHNQLGKLERLLAGARGRVLIVTESVFSMDGDTAPLREIVELKDRHGAWLLVDEAHGVGVLGPQGRGLAAASGLEGRIELQMGTLSKALGLSGGYLAAAQPVIDLMVNRARSFIYSTAPPPALAAAALQALAWTAGPNGDAARTRLRANVERLATAMELPVPPAAIMPVILGDERAAVAAAERLLDAGFLVPAIRYPTVARGSARLRVTLTAAQAPAEIDALAQALRVSTPAPRAKAGGR